MNFSAGLTPFNTVLADDHHGRRCSWTSLGSVTDNPFSSFASPSYDHVDQRQRRQSVSLHTYRTRAGSTCQLLPSGYVTSRADFKRKNDSEVADISTKTRIRLNVRGKKYETYMSTLEQFPDTLLGSYGGRCRFYDPVKEELCFNRNPESFDAILFFYQSGGSILARPSSVDEDSFADEVKFFGLIEETEELVESISSVQQENFTGHFVNLRRKMWNILEKPAECRFGRTFARLLLIVILLSVIAFCLETVVPGQRPPMERISPSANDSKSVGNIKIQDFESPLRNKGYSNTIQYQNNQSLSSREPNGTKRVNRTRPIPHDSASSVDGNHLLDQRHSTLWFCIDTVFVVFFTAEYIARVFSSPDRLKCMRSFLTIVDVCAIAPYYISHIAEAGKIYNIKSFHVIRSIRLFRVVRLFKLSRYSSGLKLLGRALYLSRWKMLSLTGCNVMAIVFYSGLLYYIEGFDEVSKFESIPQTFWWSIITMSTVGYGDIVPKSIAGKFVGACCALTGIILLFILPIPSFVTDFSQLYEKLLRKRRRDKQREENERTKIKINVATWS